MSGTDPGNPLDPRDERLRTLLGRLPSMKAPPDFESRVARAIVERGALDELVDYRRQAPSASRSHPTEEHLVPFFVAMGAGGFPARRIELGFDLGSLGMDGYVFG